MFKHVYLQIVDIKGDASNVYHLQNDVEGHSYATTAQGQQSFLLCGSYRKKKPFVANECFVYPIHLFFLPPVFIYNPALDLCLQVGTFSSPKLANFVEQFCLVSFCIGSFLTLTYL